jgi:hypothetical protein
MKSTQDIREDFVNISNEIAQLQLGKKESFALALVILEEHGRYSRGNEAANSRANGSNYSNKPTSAEQRKFLLDLGAKEEEIPATSSEASKMIAEFKRNSKGRQATAPSFK